MMNELQLNNGIVVKPPEIQFSQFGKLKTEAEEISELLKDIEVTPDNVKENKKKVAQISKTLAKLNSERIEVKNYILEPYKSFETEVNEVSAIIKQAEELVRNQIRELEEIEREEKQEKIQNIFEKRIKHYDFQDVFSFEDFLTSKHLNKSVSMNKIEKEMTEWLEKNDKEYKLVFEKQDEDLMLEYMKVKDLTTAMYNVENDRKLKEKIKTKTEKVVKPTERTTEYIVKLYDKKDLTLLKMLMDEHEIQYQVL
jgi:hypothetical protein